MKLKESAIGVKTIVQSIGYITVSEKHLPILIREGRFDLIDGMISAKKLVALEDKKKSELQEIAKDIEGYSDKLKVKELIELINAAPKSE